MRTKTLFYTQYLVRVRLHKTLCKDLSTHLGLGRLQLLNGNEGLSTPTLVLFCDPSPTRDYVDIPEPNHHDVPQFLRVSSVRSRGVEPS